MSKLISLLLTLALLTACTQRIALVRDPSGRQKMMAETSPTEPGIDPAYQDCLAEGIMLLRQEKYDAARFLLQQASHLNPSGWQAYYYRALAVSRGDDNSRAHGLLDSALIYAPHDNRTRGRIYLLLARTWEKRGHLAQAQLNYMTALNLCPDSSPAATALERLSRQRRLHQD